MYSKTADARIQSATASNEPRKARICMPSWRGFTRRAFQCGLYEAQDVLVETDDVDLVCLEPGSGFRFKERLQRRLLYRDISKRLIFQNPGLRRIRLAREYDVFVAICQNYWDLLYINAIDGWKEHCKTSVCLIDEIWAASIPKYKYWLHALKQFDHVFVGYSGTAGPLSDAIGKRCEWLPGAVDTIRFTPHSLAPTRPIDVYSLGRRHEGIHQALLRLTGSSRCFYVYDTFSASDLEPFDHRQHRDLLANMAKRSRYFMVAPGKVHDTNETGGQVETGLRYYEGAAAGTVMMGQAPDCESFRQLFDWPDAVIALQTDGSDVEARLMELASEPERLREISRRNVTEALLRHDWVYRWKHIMNVAGISPSPGMAVRESRLKELAACANDRH